MVYNNKTIFMNINELIEIVRSKLDAKFIIQGIKIEDKSFLHKNHKGHEEGRFHLKLIIKSGELAKLNKIESTRRIYSSLEIELKEYIHSIQILIN
jgi:BolA protein